MNPNWKQIVRDHLAVLGLPPEREIEIVEELALHLEAAYEAQQTSEVFCQVFFHGNLTFSTVI
jgi:hypothetical protein